MKGRGIPPRSLGMVLVFVALAAAFVVEQAVFYGWGGVLRALEFLPPNGDPTATMIVWAFGVVFPVFITALTLGVVETHIGVGEGGVRLVSRFRRREVPWDALRPSSHPPSGGWGLFVRGYTEVRGPLVFWATREQARAILSHRNAPATLFPPEYWKWVGLPAPSFRRVSR